MSSRPPNVRTTDMHGAARTPHDACTVHTRWGFLTNSQREQLKALLMEDATSAEILMAIAATWFNVSPSQVGFLMGFTSQRAHEIHKSSELKLQKHADEIEFRRRSRSAFKPWVERSAGIVPAGKERYGREDNTGG